MMYLSPLRSLVLPFLILFTVPLAVFAGVTTVFAFAVLIFQSIQVVIDLAAAFVVGFIPGWRLIFPSQIPEVKIDSASLSARRPRRPSSGSIGSGSIGSAGGATTPTSERGLGLTPSVGAERDFEGVGGWRVGQSDDAWSKINSRLEMPDQRHWQHSGKGHHRAHSTEAITPGSDAGGLVMKSRKTSPKRNNVSPNSSRVRTSVTVPAPLTTLDGDGYFPAVSPKSVKRVTLCETAVME